MTPRPLQARRNLKLGGRRLAGPAIAVWLAVVLGAGAAAACSPTDDAASVPAQDGSQSPQATNPAASLAPAQIAPEDTGPGHADANATAPGGTSAEAAEGSEERSEPAGGEPQPGDMLTDDEMRSAEDLALDAASGMLAAATDRDALSATADLAALADQPTYRVMYAQRYQTKADGPRSAEVAFYRYDTNEVVLSKVNLEDQSVTQLPVPPGYLAPLLPEEIQEAARVAKMDTKVADYLKSVGLDPESAVANGLLTTSISDESAACAETRCVRLFFFDAEHVVPTFTIVVDLATVKVVEIAPMFPSTVEEEATP